MAALSSRWLAVALVTAACARPRTTPSLAGRAAAANDVTLFRDGALIRQRIAVEAKDTSPRTVTVEIPTGVTADQIVIVDHGALAITGLHGPTVAETSAAADTGAVKPTRVTIDVTAPTPGTYSIELVYPTQTLRWDVAYTLSAPPSRDVAELFGALAIRNDSGIALHADRARLIDSELVEWRKRTADATGARLVGGKKSDSQPATPRELGALDLVDGETRVDLVHDTRRAMRSVLVYDPIGTALDNPAGQPNRDPDLGVVTPDNARVTESFEVTRDAVSSSGLPAGPVRLLERKADGSFAVLGESRLFDAAARVAAVDTIAIGGADDVTATRKRREFTIDDDGRRITEELVIEIDNKRAFAVDVLVREHLYRSQNWSLAYHSALQAAKDGPQQISLRTRVPARSRASVLYVVVYTWGP